MSCTCFFCEENRFHNNRTLDVPAETSIIYQDDNIYVTPDLFPLRLGHMLIITKEHSNSVGWVSESANNSIEKAKKFLLSEFFKSENVTFFEHGAMASDMSCNKAGSCIDHTHVHAIPQIFDLKPKIEAPEYARYIISAATEGSYDKLRFFAEYGVAYIYFQEANNPPVAYEVDRLPSQFLRIIIAKELGVDFNWHNYLRSGKKRLFLNTLDMWKKP